MSVVEVTNLTKKFKELTAVDHITFNIEEGEIFGLLGPNGAGKSTTIRMLCTLLRPTQGEAKVSSYDVQKEPAKVREKIGLVAEKIILYDRLTAFENLRLFGKLHHWNNQAINKKAQEVLELVKMEKWKDKLTGTFSTGMKQRVNIARALLNEPEVMFLDEPTLGLDPQTTRAIRKFILELKEKGITILVTTHIMAEAEMLCDRIGIIDRGKIVALDDTKGLKKLISGEDKKVFDLEVANLKDLTINSLKSLDFVNNVSQEKAYKIKIHAQGEDALGKIIDVVRKDNGKIRNVATIEPNLEDVFIHITGREMRDTADSKIISTHGGPGSHGTGRTKSRVR